MRVRQAFAHLLLSSSALLRAASPALDAHSHKRASTPLISVTSHVSDSPKHIDPPKDSRHHKRKCRFPVCRGRFRRLYIQFDDGTFRVL